MLPGGGPHVMTSDSAVVDFEGTGRTAVQVFNCLSIDILPL